MNETTFENAKVGDRVYSPLFKSKNPNDKTNTTICRIDIGLPYAVKVEPDIHVRSIAHPCFSIAGKYQIDGGQILFWENPIKEIPGRPKRKVKKTGYIGICPSPSEGISRLALTTNIYESPADLKLDNGYQLKEIEFEIRE